MHQCRNNLTLFQHFHSIEQFCIFLRLSLFCLPDIFGQGVEIDNSEAVQTARRAKELLDKLAEYKPLAKVEELGEQALGKL